MATLILLGVLIFVLWSVLAYTYPNGPFRMIAVGISFLLALALLLVCIDDGSYLDKKLSRFNWVLLSCFYDVIFHAK